MNRGNLILDSCIVNKHILGGVCAYLTNKNTFECIKSMITNNKAIGIEVLGEGCKVIL